MNSSFGKEKPVYSRLHRVKELAFYYHKNYDIIRVIDAFIGGLPAFRALRLFRAGKK